MDKQIRNIIKNQQEHERIKHTDAPTIRHMQKILVTQDAFYWKKFLPEFKKSNQKNIWEKVFYIARITLFCMYVGFLVFYELDFMISQFFSTETAPYISENDTKTPGELAEIAIEHGEYEKAKQILDAAVAKYPDGWFYDSYADLYLAMGKNDEAASILTDAIYNRFYVQNIFSTQNRWYIALKKIPPESLTSSAKEYKKCLADCDAYIEKYNTMNELIEQESYYYALSICDELKSDGAHDSILCQYYYKCYTGLRAYDECEEYLKSLYGKKTDILDIRYPSDDEIRYYLNKLDEAPK